MDPLPYGSCQQLSKYAEATQAQTATRLGLRYINEIRFPVEAVEFTDVLVGLPRFPGTWPKLLSHMLYRVTLLESAERGAHISHTLADGPRDTSVGVIFDIDAFENGTFTIDDDEFWLAFEEIRRLKNDIFFGGLTSSGQERYR